MLKKYSTGLPIFTTLFLFFIPFIFITLQHTQISPKNSDYTIIIDVGHGGNDPGKVSSSGTKEKDINLQIAKQLKDILIQDGFNVYLTRENDTNLSDLHATNQKRSDLGNRIRFIQQNNADFVISIHQNSFSDSSVHGSQIFFHKSDKKSEFLAHCLQDSLSKLDPNNIRPIKESTSYYLLKNCNIPIVLIECGFLSNPNEEALLTSADYQNQIAVSIQKGISNYINNNNIYALNK